MFTLLHVLLDFLLLLPRECRHYLFSLISIYFRKSQSFKEVSKKATDRTNPASLSGNSTQERKTQFTSATLSKVKTFSVGLDRTTRNVQRLMVSPPSSLSGINDKEKEEMIKELQKTDNLSCKQGSRAR